MALGLDSCEHGNELLSCIEGGELWTRSLTIVVSNRFAVEFLTQGRLMINSSEQWLFVWAQWRLKGVCPLRASSTGPCFVRQLMGDTAYMVKSHMYANQASSCMAIPC